jgi:hypothetical protein
MLSTDGPRVKKTGAGSSLVGVAKNVALLGVTLAVLAFGLEIGVRIFTDTPPAIGVRDTVVGKRHRPGFSDDVFVEEAGRKVHLRFNREGFRGADLPYERDPGTRRIALLGDSFVAAVACDEEETAAHRLERLLDRSHPEVRWEVLNFGVSGSSTGQQLALYREIVSRYRPDIVLVAYFIGNDFADNSTRLSANPRIYFELDERGDLVRVPLSTTRRKLSNWLNLHSRFYVWQKRANDILQRRTAEGHLAFSTAPSDVLDEVWELNERLIVALSEEVDRDGSRFVLVLYPDAAQVHDDRWEAVLQDAGEDAADLDREHAERRLVEIAASHRIPVVTMTDEFRHSAAGRRTVETDDADQLYFGGIGHFTPRGHLVAASAVHRFLTEGAGRPILESALSD